MWALTKKALFKHFARLDSDLTQVQFEAEVDYVCHSIADQYDS